MAMEPSSDDHEFVRLDDERVAVPGERIVDCAIESRPLDLAALRRSLPVLADCGGYVSFEGIVRNVNHGKGVLRLEYETYDALALKELQRICEFANERFGLRYIRAIHRKGALAIGETAVVIQVLSRHRGEAFEGCRYVIDQLKARVPIWKKEFYDDGSTAWTQCHEHGH
jgi:molybdopterin synthase catalytic subunit